MTANKDSQQINASATFWNARRVARLTVFIALAAVGSLIKIPSPTGTVALDAAPGYFSAIGFGWIEGALVSALGHLLTAATTGFPLGIFVHLLVAAEQALWAFVFWFVNKKSNLWLASAAAIFCNGVIGGLILIPMGGTGLFLSMLPGLVVGSAVNVILAALAFVGISKSGILK